MSLLFSLDTGPADVHDTNVDRVQSRKTGGRPLPIKQFRLECARQGQPCHSPGVHMGMTSKQEGERRYSLMAGLFFRLMAFPSYHLCSVPLLFAAWTLGGHSGS